MYKHIYIFIILFFGAALWTTAQEKNDLGTETVTVTKAYTPTISDAFKINSLPNLNDSIVLQKKEINYSIFSVPVASTFTPAKGKATGVKKAAPEKLFNSYASLGLGNFNNALADFYTSRALSREETLDIGLNHNSSSGDIDGTALDNVYYNTKLNATYAKKSRDLHWGAHLGFQHRLYNWYGIPDGAFSDDIINGIDERQNYYNVEAGGHVVLEDSFFKNAEIVGRRFWDAADSGENRAVLKTTFEFPINQEMITLKAKLDYVGGDFTYGNLNFDNASGINYSHIQFGINPNFTILQDDLTLNLGVGLVYGLDAENSDGDFFIYPEVTASYRLVDETIIGYGGVQGELRQNSYYDFVGKNPFVSPTLEIQPTDAQYNAYVGVKGKLGANVSYNLKGSYTAENRRPLFKLNPQNLFRNDAKGYFFGNSFEVFYDDVKTLGIFGELTVAINRNFSLGMNAEVYDYDTETDNPAWNLPNLTASLFMDYQIDANWFVGANLFFVGERDDLASVVIQNVAPSDFPATLVTLDSYFDANAHAGYRLTEQWSVFVKANNIGNTNYERFANYPVQGFQILGGVTHKFDF
ncbi:TonB-dependent receptor [Arenibacter sp. GZD96]|uniref:hypothetical protein n=1 Tax=Aurantibrevibacter litoralis TaxID=3106030 RepID=UPI002AFEBFD6|nr:hypothetical protein [Arenibacter sp. GZD-96]MEA1785132.1 TonB-dependent receptor [Arenibacter sp. GZD-96]